MAVVYVFTFFETVQKYQQADAVPNI